MKRVAKLVNTLLQYEVPELVHLKDRRTNFLAMCLIGIENAPDYLVVSVNAGDWERFLNDRCDTRYLFTTPVSRVIYQFNRQALCAEKVQMIRREEGIPDEWLPDGQLFASELDNIDLPEVEGVDTRTLLLDGEWDSSEFGRLQRKISDIYSFVSVVDGTHDPLENKKARRSFYDKPLAGGSSYSSLFSELEAAAPIRNRLRLEKIRKESPGYMTLWANPKTFDAVSQIISDHMGLRTDARERYLTLRKLLSERKLLRFSIANYDPSTAPDQIIRSLADDLYNAIGIERTDRIIALTHGNTLAFAKIAMALYRRIDDAMMYFAQGRAKFKSSE